ncbi:TPA: hypothetical protein MFG93_005019 [Klebsiella pneumoniae]|nr:hypothetical protein [Klebsiella pneumoniae]
MEKRDFIKRGAILAALTPLYSNSTLKKISDKYSYITPEDFGASGDGVTDDTIYFQTAINFCVDNKLKLFLSGSYLISRTLNVYGDYSVGSRVCIQGMTSSATILFSGQGVCLNIGAFGADINDFNIKRSGIAGGVALKVTGSNGQLKNLIIIGEWDVSYWLIDFSNGVVVNCRDFGDKNKLTGISWLINSCVNTSFDSNYTTYRNFGYVLDKNALVFDKDINELVPSNYKRQIHWGCEGLNFNSIKTIWCNNGIRSSGIAISFSNCIIDLCHKTILTWYAELYCTNCWFASSKISESGKNVFYNENISTVVIFIGNHFTYNVAGKIQYAVIEANSGSIIGNVADGFLIKVRARSESVLSNVGNIEINLGEWHILN